LRKGGGEKRDDPPLNLDGGERGVSLAFSLERGRSMYKYKRKGREHLSFHLKKGEERFFYSKKGGGIKRKSSLPSPQREKKKREGGAPL